MSNIVKCISDWQMHVQFVPGVEKNIGFHDNLVQNSRQTENIHFIGELVHPLLTVSCDG